LPYSSIAREYLLKEGFPSDRVIKTGSPMFEVLQHYAPKINASRVLNRLKLQPRSFFVVSAHREENVDSERNLANLGEILNMLAADYGRRVIVSTHPRTRKRFEARKMRFHKNVELLKPLGFSDYVCLQKNAAAVLSDSGTITEEASILGFTGINLREAHERPEGMEEAAVIMTGLEPLRVKQAIALGEQSLASGALPLRKVADYTCPNVSEKVARIILSYTDYINRTVWRRAA
ncbi:MAG TPA: UDP-N-acetylglucosamine 2-epimerase, partial [Elusimicrobiales bacterium]|nr:UDP-N-acetylglucosamine 2-epimerase [Elusimicrobiales bacterium]